MIKMKQLVSQFANMTSKTPIQGDLESLVSFMKTDERLKFLPSPTAKPARKPLRQMHPSLPQPATSKEARVRTTSGNSPTYLS